MYGGTHDATQRALANLSGIVREAAGGAGETIVALRGQRLQVNEKTMRGSQCGVLAVSYLTEHWSRRGRAAVRIRVDVDTSELAAFAEIFHSIDVAAPVPPQGAPARTVPIQTRINEAVAFQREGKIGEAIERYLAILADEPENLEAHNNLANVYARIERFEDAARLYEKAIELDPGNAQVHYNLGHAYLRQGENRKALNAFEQAVELDPALKQAADMIRVIKGG